MVSSVEDRYDLKKWGWGTVVFIPLQSWSFHYSRLQSITVVFNQTAISTIRLQSSKSKCNLSNQGAISTIRQQSPQSECNHCNQNKTPCNMPESIWRVGICICKLLNFCHLSNQTAISTIRLQSPQSYCNVGRLQSDCWDCSLIAEMAVWLLRLVESPKLRPLIGWEDRI